MRLAILWWVGIDRIAMMVKHGRLLGGFCWCVPVVRIVWQWLLIAGGSKENSSMLFHWMPLTFTFQMAFCVLALHQQSADVVEAWMMHGSQHIKLLTEGSNRTFGVLLKYEQGSIDKDLIVHAQEGCHLLPVTCMFSSAITSETV